MAPTNGTTVVLCSKIFEPELLTLRRVDRASFQFDREDLGGAFVGVMIGEGGFCFASVVATTVVGDECEGMTALESITAAVAVAVVATTLTFDAASRGGSIIPCDAVWDGGSSVSCVTNAAAMGAVADDPSGPVVVVVVVVDLDASISSWHLTSQATAWSNSAKNRFLHTSQRHFIVGVALSLAFFRNADEIGGADAMGNPATKQQN